LKALVGDTEPEVIGHCFSALLNLAPRESLGFVAKFLHSPEHDLRIEAAGALADSREPEALDYLKQFWNGQTEPEVKRVVLTLLAGSPLPSAAEFLFSILQDAAGQMAVDALTALSKNRYRAQFQERAAALVADRKDADLVKVLGTTFGAK
jgi:HEAT repeat protein